MHGLLQLLDEPNAETNVLRGAVFFVGMSRFETVHIFVAAHLSVD
jgi:hypothetical protein